MFTRPFQKITGNFLVQIKLFSNVSVIGVFVVIIVNIGTYGTPSSTVLIKSNKMLERTLIGVAIAVSGTLA